MNETMTIAITTVASIIVGTPLVLFLFKIYFKDLNDLSSKIAEKINGTVEHLKLGYPVVRVRANGLPLVIRYQPSNQYVSANMVIEITKPPPFQLLLTRKDLDKNIRETILFADKLTCDDRFTIKTKDVQKCKLFLSSPAVGAVKEHLLALDAYLYLGPKTISIHQLVDGKKSQLHSTKGRFLDAVFKHRLVNPDEIVTLSADLLQLTKVLKV